MEEEEPSNRKASKAKGITRRRFLTTMGASAAVAAASAGKLAADAPKEPELLKADETARITLSINGRRHHLLVEPRWSLLYVLRERLGLTATKVGCEREKRPRRSQRRPSSGVAWEWRAVSGSWAAAGRLPP